METRIQTQSSDRTALSPESVWLREVGDLGQPVMRWLVLALTLAGCGSNSDAIPNSCTPGAEVACTCSDGRAGSQRCGSSGAFESCVCLALDASIDVAATDGMTDEADVGDTTIPGDATSTPDVV